MNLNRIGAIFIKEVQDVRRNTNVIYMFLIPIVLTLIWDRLIPGMPEGFSLSLGLLFLVIMVGMYVPSMTIAEEKEKNTIEVLMLSPATPVEVFIGKGLLTFISIMITGAILIGLTGTEIDFLVVIVGTAATSIFSILLGIIVGLLSPNQMSTGIIGTPIYLSLILIPQLSMMNVGVLKTISKALPTYYYFEILMLSMTEGKNLGELYAQLGILLLSILITVTVLITVYKKKGLEQ